MLTEEQKKEYLSDCEEINREFKNDRLSSDFEPNYVLYSRLRGKTRFTAEKFSGKSALWMKCDDTAAHLLAFARKWFANKEFHIRDQYGKTVDFVQMSCKRREQDDLIEQCKNMTDDEWLSGCRFYRSGKDKCVRMPNGKSCIVTNDATGKTFLTVCRTWLLYLKPGRTKEEYDELSRRSLEELKARHPEKFSSEPAETCEHADRPAGNVQDGAESLDNKECADETRWNGNPEESESMTGANPVQSRCNLRHDLSDMPTVCREDACDTPHTHSHIHTCSYTHDTACTRTPVNMLTG